VAALVPPSVPSARLPLFPKVTEELAATPPQPQPPAPPMVRAMVLLLRLPQAVQAERAALASYLGPDCRKSSLRLAGQGGECEQYWPGGYCVVDEHTPRLPPRV